MKDLTSFLKAPLCFAFILLFSSSSGLTAQNNFLDFDGNNDYVALPQQFGLYRIPQMTIEAWVYLDAITGSHRVYSDPGSNNTNQNLIVAGNGSVTCALNNGQNRLGQTAPGVVTAQTWTHLAMVYNGGGANNSQRLILYVNGSQVPLNYTGTMPQLTPNAITRPPNIGARDGANQFFNGKIDELRIWTVARTQAEVNATMNTTLTGTETGLYSYYNFDQGVCAGSNPTVTTLTELSGNGPNGTLVNFSLNGCNSNWVCGGSACGFTSALQPPVIPTLSQWGLILLSMVILAIGSIVVWKQKNRVLSA